MKVHLYYPVITQIERLRERMGDNISPADDIVAGRYPDGSKIRRAVHLKRISRLKKLENYASELLTEDYARFIRKHGF